MTLHSENNLSAQADSLRAETARQLKDSQEAAKRLAELCAEAEEEARRHQVPHAGVGCSPQS